MAGWAIRVALTSAGSPHTRLSVSGGRPASRKHCTSAIALAGVSSAGFSTTLQPAASAAPSLRAGRLTGKFQAVKAATGPTGGCVTVCDRMPSTRGGTLRPYRRRASSAWKSMMSADSRTSRSASAKGLPCSSVSTVAMASARSRISTAARRSVSQRSSAERRRQTAKPRAAAAAAASTCAASANGSSPSTLPSAGFSTSRRPPPASVIQRPATCRARVG